MSLIGGFKDRISNTAKAVSKKTQEATDVVKLNGRVTGMQEEIDRLFTQVGKAYYAVRGAGQNEAAEKLCAQIERLQADMKAVRIQLDSIRNVKRCLGCGEVQPLAAAYCASCGTKMPDAPRIERTARPAAPRPERTAKKEEPKPESVDPLDVTIDWPGAPAEEDGADDSAE